MFGLIGALPYEQKTIFLTTVETGYSKLGYSKPKFYPRQNAYVLCVSKIIGYSKIGYSKHRLQ